MKTLKITAIAFVALALVLVVFTAGCTQSSGTSSNATTVKDLRIGYQPSTHQMAEITAQNKGWFTRIWDKVTPF